MRAAELRIAGWALFAALLLAGCPEVTVVQCLGDGDCPGGGRCGEAGVCVVPVGGDGGTGGDGTGGGGVGGQGGSGVGGQGGSGVGGQGGSGVGGQGSSGVGGSGVGGKGGSGVGGRGGSGGTGETDCNDGLDNDGDVAIDCADADCEGVPRSCYSGGPGEAGVGECLAGTQRCTAGVWAGCSGSVTPIAESCNGKDDDCDNQIDDGLAGLVELCANGLDDDCDAAIDCADAACAGLVPCGPAEQCGDLLDNDLDGLTEEGCVCGGGQRQPCYTGPAAAAGRGACRPGEQFCAGGLFSDQCTGQVLPGPAELCGNLVDDDCDGGTDETCANGELCGNGLDDDLDGVADCFDPECFLRPPCGGAGGGGGGGGSIEANCADTIDNDADTVADCLDPDCFASPDCMAPGGAGGGGPLAPVEYCRNGRDDDGNGLVDCHDPRCTVEPFCIGPFAAEVCDDRWDDDVDGQTDCFDSDCFANPRCDPNTADLQVCNGLSTDGDLDGLYGCGDLDCARSSMPSCPTGTPERCAQVGDQDGDGAADDADGNCIGAPCGPDNQRWLYVGGTPALTCGCPSLQSESDCSDGLDDDCDGQLDCADFDCQGSSLPSELSAGPGSWICRNGIDDDCDGLADNCGAVGG